MKRKRPMALLVINLSLQRQSFSSSKSVRKNNKKLKNKQCMRKSVKCEDEDDGNNRNY